MPFTAGMLFLREAGIPARTHALAVINLSSLPHRMTRCLRYNLSALFVGVVAVGWLYLLYEPLPAGSDPDRVRVDLAVLQAGGEFNSRQTEFTALQGQEAPAESDGAADHGQELDRPLTGRTALLHDLERLERGHEFLDAVADYTATFTRIERVGGQLDEPQVIQMKLRHEPLSIYLKWHTADVGRELLYVAGRNNGDMLVRLGGVRGRLLPAIYLNPEGRMALREARHPATHAGLLHLVEQMLANRHRDLGYDGGVECRCHPDCEVAGRRCDCVVVEYDRPELSADYRKTVHYIDRDWSIPIMVKSFGWPGEVEGADEARLDETTLVEQYAYTDIRLNAGLIDDDFDRRNRKYAFDR